MIEKLQTPATIVRDQLAEVLIAIPLKVCEAMTDRDKFRVMDWVEMVKDCTAGMYHVPLPEVFSVRQHLNDQQKLGEWRAFTTWRTQAPLPNQRSLFPD